MRASLHRSTRRAGVCRPFAFLDRRQLVGDRVKLISWNIQWCRGSDGRVDPARIARVAKEMADFDVLCLQEVARNYTDLAGSSGEDQYQALAGLFPGYAVVKGVAV